MTTDRLPFPQGPITRDDVADPIDLANVVLLVALGNENPTIDVAVPIVVFFAAGVAKFVISQADAVATISNLKAAEKG